MSSTPQSQSDADAFSLRVVTLDYYMSPPIPNIDFSYSSFQGRNVEEVPVIRIYGSTPAGQKACLHVHQALPYLYIPCPDNAIKSPEEGDKFIHMLSNALEKALKHKGSSTTKRQHVHECRLVRAKKLYGYHPSDDLFVKIYLYYPHEVGRAATMLLDGVVLNTAFQPHESHIPYLLQFLRRWDCPMVVKSQLLLFVKSLLLLLVKSKLLLLLVKSFATCQKTTGHATHRQLRMSLFLMVGSTAASVLT